MKIGVSACLIGYAVRYNGATKTEPELVKLLEGHEVIPLCPEMAAELSVPHEPIERKGDRIISKDGRDLTDALHIGVQKEYLRIRDCDLLILKTKSPSCGYGRIYDGTFTNTLIRGNGLLAEKTAGRIRILTENDLDEIRKELSGSTEDIPQ